MSEKKILTSEIPRGKAAYHIFEPLVDFLLANGNELANPKKWSVSQTGYTCGLKQPLDFNLIEANFVLPEDAKVDKSRNRIDYQIGFVVIFTKNPK